LVKKYAEAIAIRNLKQALRDFRLTFLAAILSGVRKVMTIENLTMAGCLARLLRTKDAVKEHMTMVTQTHKEPDRLHRPWTNSFTHFTGNGFAMAVMTGLLVLVSALNGYMNVTGLMCILPTIKRIVVLLGIVIELGKLTLIAILHTHWVSAHRGYRCFFLAGAILFTALTFTDVFGFLSYNHTRTAEGLDMLTVEKDALDREEALLRAQMQQIDDTLDGLPDNHVSKRLKLREAAGYQQIEQRLVEIAGLRAGVSQRQISSTTHLGPIFNNARMIGMDEEAAVFVYLFVLCIATEMASIGTLIAIIKFNKAARQVTPRRLPEKTVVDDEAENTEPEGEGPVDEESAPTETVVEEQEETPPDAISHQRNHTLAVIVGRYDLSDAQLAEITGKKREHTVRAWLAGESTIPEKAMRDLLRWEKSLARKVKKLRVRS